MKMLILNILDTMFTDHILFSPHCDYNIIKLLCVSLWPALSYKALQKLTFNRNHDLCLTVAELLL